MFRLRWYGRSGGLFALRDSFFYAKIKKHLDKAVPECAKEKTKQSAVQPAFIKRNTIQNILEITSNDAADYGLNPHVLMKIKVEIDTNLNIVMLSIQPIIV